MVNLIRKISLFLLLWNIVVYVSPNKGLCENILNGFGGVGLDTYLLGTRFLMDVSEKHAWGPEITYLVKNNKKYLSVSIVLEARLNKNWINQMGLAGYIGDKNAKPFGIRLSSGLETFQTKNLAFPVALRTDIIFDKNTIITNNFELGIRVKF